MRKSSTAVAVAAVLAYALAACHSGSGDGSGDRPPTRPQASQPASAEPSQTVDLAAQFPGQVSLHFASDPGASSITIDCSGASFDVTVGTDGRPVQWQAATSDNANNFIGRPIGGLDVSPASGTLPGGGTATVHVSGAPTSLIDSFWIGVTDVRGSGATLEVDCGH